MVEGETKAKKLYALGLHFEGLIRVVEKYWEARPSLVYMTCCGIGHEWMGGYENQPAKCIICTEAYKFEKHQYGVTGCTKNRGKVYLYITVKCANCGGSHIVNFPRYISRQKAGIKASKKR